MLIKKKECYLCRQVFYFLQFLEHKGRFQALSLRKWEQNFQSYKKGQVKPKRG
jgi:hypothetical protein